MQDVRWSEDGEHVAIVSSQGSFILRYQAEGAEAARMEVEAELAGGKQAGVWYKSAYLFVAGTKLFVAVGGKEEEICYVNPHLFVLRFIPAMNLLFFIDTQVCFGFTFFLVFTLRFHDRSHPA